MENMRGLRWAGALLCVLAWSSLACSGMKFGFEDGKKSAPVEQPPNQTSPTANNTTGSGSANDTSSTTAETSPPIDETPITLLPSPEALRRAGAAKLPPVEPGQSLAGPFDGPQATLVYANRSGEVTLYHPEAAVAYFATGNDFSWNYVITHDGYFKFEEGGELVLLEKPPKELTAWPRAIPVAKSIASLAAELVELEESDGARARARRAELLDRQRSIWKVLSGVNERLGATVEVLVAKIGAPDCEEKREGDVLIGCY